jgi:uncharacterized protein
MKQLIVLGASARAVAFSAISSGYSPYAIDLFADRDLAAICPAVKISRYPHEFLTALATAPPAPWLYTGGLENSPRLIDRLAKLRPLLENIVRVVGQVREPMNLRRVAEEAECGFPEIHFDLSSAKPPDQTWLMKPRRSSGGTAIRIVQPGEIARLPRGCYLQAFVEGESASAEFVAAGGRVVLLGVTRQLLGRDFGLDRPFLYVGSLGPLGLKAQEIHKLTRLGNLLSENFQLTGLFNVDFVRTETQLWPVEVNPRYSASIEVLERVSGQHHIDLHVQACVHSKLPDAPSFSGGNNYACKAVVYARRDGIIPPALDQLVTEWNFAGQPPGIADLPRVGDSFTSGQPVVTVMAAGRNLAEVEDQLRQRCSIVERLLTSSH